MPITVIHLFNDNDAALKTGSHVAARIQQVAADKGLKLEVFCFGPAQAALTAPTRSDAHEGYKKQIAELAQSGVKVGACVDAANTSGSAVALEGLGIHLEFARDAFVRFGLEGAAVITF
jgi:hypothetical protein